MDFKFKKKYGQNFLKDKNIVQKIINLCDAKQDDLIIEIGLGSGALTKYLVQKKSFYLGYEIDTDLKSELNKYITDKSNIIFDDVLNRNIKEDISNIKYNRLYIISNIPYYITTPIILKIINSNLNEYKSIYMVQKEVADRYTSKPGNKGYGSITVLLNYYYDIKKEFIVKSSSFIPVPKVDSAVITFTSKPKDNIDINLFNKFIHDAFKYKRKTLNNNLKEYDRKKIDEVLESHGYSLNNRAEDIPYEVYKDIIVKCFS